MALQKEQIAGLDDLNNRIASGYTANAQDQANLNYGKSKGYAYNPVPQGATKIAGPSGLQGLNESQIFRQGQDIYRLPEVKDSLTSEQITDPNQLPVAEPQPDLTDISVAGTKAYQDSIRAEEAKQSAIIAEKEKATQAGISNIDKYKDQLDLKSDEFELRKENLGYTRNFEQKQAIDNKMAQVYAEYEKALVAEEGRTGSAGSIYGRQALLKRQQAAELSGLSAMSSALGGNMAEARSAAKESIDMKYDAILDQYNMETQQLEYIYKDLDRVDKKRADTRLEALTERQRLVEEQKETEMNISNIMLSAAQSGANKDVLDSIMKSKTVGEAIVNSGKYLQETSKTNFLKFTDPETGEETYVDPNTGKAITAGKSDIENGILVDASGNAYNIASYATDPNHEANVQSALNRIGKMGSINDMNAYIKSKSPQSKVTGEMIASSAEKYGVSWEMMMAIMEADSNYADPRMNDQGQISSQGARQRAYRTKNPGNVGNVDSGSNVDRGTWEAGVDAVAKKLSLEKDNCSTKDSY